MPIDAQFVSLLRCPETKQPVSLADAALLARLNEQISRGDLSDRAGEAVSEPLDQGLVREDGQVLYPVRDEIPEMLIGSGISLS